VIVDIAGAASSTPIGSGSIGRAWIDKR